MPRMRNAKQQWELWQEQCTHPHIHWGTERNSDCPLSLNHCRLTVPSMGTSDVLSCFLCHSAPTSHRAGSVNRALGGYAGDWSSILPWSPLAEWHWKSQPFPMALQSHIYLCRVRLPNGNKKPRHYFLSRQLNKLIISTEGKKYCLTDCCGIQLSPHQSYFNWKSWRAGTFLQLTIWTK